MICQEDGVKGCAKVLRPGEQWGSRPSWRQRERQATRGLTPRTRGPSQTMCFSSKFSEWRGRGHPSGMNALLLWGSSDRSSQGLFKKVSSGTTDPHDFILTVAGLSQNHSCHFKPPVLFWKQNPLPPAIHYSISEQHTLSSADISIYLWLDVQ